MELRIGAARGFLNGLLQCRAIGGILLKNRQALIRREDAKIKIRATRALEQIETGLSREIAAILAQSLEHQRHQMHLARRVKGGIFRGCRAIARRAFRANALDQTKRRDLLRRAAVSNLKIA